jgi:DNA topoisomerase-2
MHAYPTPLSALRLRSKLLEKINKKNKSAGVKPFQVKSHLWVFVNALIENPAFDSQARTRTHTCCCLLALLLVVAQRVLTRIRGACACEQTKETLTSKVSAFGSKCEISEDFMKKARPSRARPRTCARGCHAMPCMLQCALR